jgi:hypothetical protein
VLAVAHPNAVHTKHRQLHALTLITAEAALDPADATFRGIQGGASVAQSPIMEVNSAADS